MSSSLPTTTSTSTATQKRRLRRLPSQRPTPPPQDKLVIVFITASGIFALISLSPFLFGNFPNETHLNTDWFHKRKDVMGLKPRLLQNDGNNNIIGSDINSLSLARGASGLPPSQTPALVGARHGHITCSDDAHDVDSSMDYLAYWNDPGSMDLEFISPFDVNTKDNNHDSTKKERIRKYITFEPDRGGWNNIRMSMEIIFVFAAVTGRTLVLPPDTPFYLLGNKDGDRGSKHHGFADFIDMNGIKRQIDIITMKEFLEMEADTKDGRLSSLPKGRTGEKILKSADFCYYMAKSDRSCDHIYGFLKDHAYVPPLQAARDCLIFDAPSYNLLAKEPTTTDEEILDLLNEEKTQQIHNFCHERNPIFYGRELASAPLIHFHSGDKYHRLLNHFYTFLLFTDAKVGNHYKRFVRDYLHYVDAIYCAAGKIIRLLEEEAGVQAAAAGRGVSSPGFSSMHIRRGDFQYKKTKISAEEWLNSTLGILHPKEVVYIATDEKDRSFFEPLEAKYNLRFLDEFTEEAGLEALDPNYKGMIDSIVASRGRVFFGTWFSTFSGYINRMRGYHGFPGNTSYYGQSKHKFSMHQWLDHEKVLTAREWPSGWYGIDGDTELDHF